VTVHETSRWTRRGVVAGLAVSPAVLLAACSGSGGHGGSGKAASSAPATLTVSPADAAAAADPGQGVTVTAANGRISAVTVTDAAGNRVAGGLSADGASWKTTGELSPGTRYTVTATAVNGTGQSAAKRTAFTTGATFVGYYTPDDGTTVGVGMPVSINFTHPVSDRAAVQKAITVTAPGVEVVGHWFSDTRLDYRPQNFWAAGTKVTLSLRLKGVQGAPGVYGKQQKDVSFTIGRSQTSVVDLAAKKITVTRDGKVVQTWPVSGGSPQHTTWSGIMVIAEKFLQTRMNSQSVNLGGEYDIPDVPHAQRLTTSGTFIHGNYWAAESVFGSQNTSHGCVGLHDVKGAGDASTPAAQFYNSSITGDVVQIINSGDQTVAPDNGLNGWNLSWADWKSGSAI
jgi:hypothetical protein